MASKKKEIKKWTDWDMDCRYEEGRQSGQTDTLLKYGVNKLTLNISFVPFDAVLFYWLSPLVDANKIEKIIVSERMSKYIFASGMQPWQFYRGCEIEIKHE